MENLPEIKIGSPDMEECKKYLLRLPPIKIPSSFSPKRKVEEVKDDEFSMTDDELGDSFKDFLSAKLQCLRNEKESDTKEPNEIAPNEDETAAVEEPASDRTSRKPSNNNGTPTFEGRRKNPRRSFYAQDLFNATGSSSAEIDLPFERSFEAKKLKINSNNDEAKGSDPEDDPISSPNEEPATDGASKREPSIYIGTPTLEEMKKFLHRKLDPSDLMCTPVNSSPEIDSSFERLLEARKLEMNNNKQTRKLNETSKEEEPVAVEEPASDGASKGPSINNETPTLRQGRGKNSRSSFYAPDLFNATGNSSPKIDSPLERSLEAKRLKIISDSGEGDQVTNDVAQLIHSSLKLD